LGFRREERALLGHLQTVTRDAHLVGSNGLPEPAATVRFLMRPPSRCRGAGQLFYEQFDWPPPGGWMAPWFAIMKTTRAKEFRRDQPIIMHATIRRR
jgi:hypothetical protein